LIVSALASPAKQALLERKVCVHTVEPLDEDRQRRLIDAYLQRHSKGLSDTDRKALQDHPLSDSPLFLKVVLEELRIFGKITDTTAWAVEAAIRQRLDYYLQAQSLDDLFERFLKRLEDDATPQTTLVADFFALLLAAPFGLAESDATAILEQKGHTRLALSALLQQAQEHLAQRDGRLDFFHDYLRQAAFNRYIQTTERFTPWRELLLKHAYALGPKDPGALKDAPALVMRLGNTQATLDFLSRPAWIIALEANEQTEVLKELWLSLDDRQALLQRYEALPKTEETAKAAQITGRVIREHSSNYDLARSLLEVAQALFTELHGDVSDEVARVYKDMARVYRHGLKDYAQAIACQQKRLAIVTQLKGEVSNKEAVV
jgi:tetratricopeptide (TPR) repeat protein